MNFMQILSTFLIKYPCKYLEALQKSAPTIVFLDESFILVHYFMKSQRNNQYYSSHCDRKTYLFSENICVLSLRKFQIMATQ